MKYFASPRPRRRQPSSFQGSSDDDSDSGFPQPLYFTPEDRAALDLAIAFLRKVTRVTSLSLVNVSSGFADEWKLLRDAIWPRFGPTLKVLKIGGGYEGIASVMGQPLPQLACLEEVSLQFKHAHHFAYPVGFDVISDFIAGSCATISTLTLSGDDYPNTDIDDSMLAILLPVTLATGSRNSSLATPKPSAPLH
jgi:hypothetical protein